ncbi:Cell wall synthesis protein kre9 precursor [Lecanora helva]
MLFRLFLLLAGVAPYALADVEFTSPSAGQTLTGGSTIKVAWKDSGDKPAISDLQGYQLFLCAGGNDEKSFIQLAPIVQTGKFSTGNAASGTVSVSVGGDDKNAYFLKMISTATGGTVVNYSDRFTLSGMKGTFPPNVEQGIKGVTGTGGPKTENNVDKNAAEVPANGQAGGPYAVTYTAQTGLTKYAPMQGKPGTKITAKNPTPQYPTSSVKIAKTFLPTPSQVTTMTVSATYSASSHENTASPAPMPHDDMQKYLARWRD